MLLLKRSHEEMNTGEKDMHQRILTFNLKLMVVISASVLLSLIFTAATFPQTKPLTLNDCIKIALKQSPMVSASEYDKASASVARSAIEKSYLPQFSGSSHLIAAPTAGYDPAITNGGEFAAQLGLSYRLYEGGLKNVLLEKGDLSVQQQNTLSEITRGDLIYATSLAYWQAVKEKKELDILGRNVNALDDYLQLIKSLYAAGQANKTDILKTQVQLGNANVALQAKEASFNNSIISLARLVGVEPKTVDVDTTLSTAISYDSTFNAGGSIDLVSAKLQESSALLEADAIRTELKPRISIEADAGALTSLPNLQEGFSNVFGASLGINVSVPLFTFGSIADRATSAEYTAKSISERNKYLQQSLSAQFAQALNNVKLGERLLLELESNLKAAGENFLLSKAKYAGGQGSSLEVLDAIQLLNNLQLSIEETRNDILANAYTLKRLNFDGEIQ